MFISSAERERVSLLRRHAHAAGSLAQAVADAVSPLALSLSLQVGWQHQLRVGCGAEGQAVWSASCNARSLCWLVPQTLARPVLVLLLQVAVQSFGVVAEALRSLAAVSEAVELDVNKVGAGVGWLGWQETVVCALVGACQKPGQLAYAIVAYIVCLSMHAWCHTVVADPVAHAATDRRRASRP